MSSTRYKPSSPEIDVIASDATSIRERIGTAFLRRILSRIQIGRLQVITPAGTMLTRVASTHTALDATLTIHRWRMLYRLIRHGDIGFAESYIDGDWSSPNLAALIELAARNRAPLDDTLAGSWWKRVSDRICHARHANTRRGSRRNIMAHYDLGNAFYARWLDKDMSYSSALFADASETLESAQNRKLDAIISQLDLRGGERVLEIGCGWGQLATRLAASGADVVAVTLSPAQREIALQRIADAGYADKVDIRLQDYRDIEGQFDRIVSIEMFEAVGEAYWPTYFTQLSHLLSPTGRALLQVITIDDSRFDAYRRDVDFIQLHVFPGGMLPSPSKIEELARAAGMKLDEEQRFGQSYAWTLAEWHRRFQREWANLTGQGFDERFKRLWEYYLTYCEGGFAAQAIDVGFYRLSHAGQFENATEALPQ